MVQDEIKITLRLDGEEDLDKIKGILDGVIGDHQVKVSDNFSQVTNNAKDAEKAVGSVGDAAQQTTGLLAKMTSMAAGGIGIKNLGDLSIQNAMDTQKNKVFVNTWTKTGQEYESVWNQMDTATNNGLVSMRQLIPSMNAFKAATGINGKQVGDLSDEMTNFGSAVFAMTGSEELASSAMYSLSRGIKGAYAALDQYGITEESLMRTGLWTGREDDVEGYMAAVNEVINQTVDVDGLMNTTSGKITQYYKKMSVAGRWYGEMFNQYVADPTMDFLLGMSKSSDGWADKFIFGLMGIVSTGAMVLPIISDISMSIPLLSKLPKIGGIFKGGKGAGEDIGKSSDMIGSMSCGLDKLSKNLKGNLKGMGAGMLMGAVAIAGTMALATEALILVQAPLWALAETGKFYKAKEKSITAGADGLKKTASVLLPVIAGVSALIAVFSVGSATLPLVLAGSLATAVTLPIIFGLAAETLLLFQAPLLALAEVGKYYSTNSSKIQSGATGIKMAGVALKSVNEAVMTLPSIAWANFSGKLAGFLGGFDGSIAGQLKDLTRDEGVIDQLNVFIEEFNKKTIAKILPEKVTNLQSAATGLTAIEGVVNSLDDINWASIKKSSESKNLTTYAPTAMQKLQELTAEKGLISEINTFIQKINEMSIVPFDEGVLQTLNNTFTLIEKLPPLIEKINTINTSMPMKGYSSEGLISAYNMVRNFINHINANPLPDLTDTSTAKLEAVSTYITRIKDTVSNDLTTLKTAVTTKASDANLYKIINDKVYGNISQLKNIGSDLSSKIVTPLTQTKSKVITQNNDIVNSFKYLKTNVTSSLTSIERKIWEYNKTVAGMAKAPDTGSGGSPYEETYQNGSSGSPFEDYTVPKITYPEGGDTFIFQAEFMERGFENRVIEAVKRWKDLEAMRS